MQQQLHIRMERREDKAFETIDEKGVPDETAKPDSQLPENNFQARITGCFCLLNLLSINQLFIINNTSSTPQR
jgi:hypothetical protein